MPTLTGSGQHDLVLCVTAMLLVSGCGRTPATTPAATTPVVPMRNGVPLTAEQIRERDAYIQRAAAKKHARARAAEAEQLKQAQLKIFQAQMQNWQFRRSRGESVPLPFPTTPVTPANSSPTSDSQRPNPFAANPDTFTPEPASASSASAPVTVAGVGLSRGAIEGYFERHELGGFTFSSSAPVAGLPRTHGDLLSGDNEAKVEVIGAYANIQKVSVMVAMPNDDDGMVRRNVGRMHSLLRLVAPEWAHGPGWLNANVPTILRSGQEVNAVAGARRISLVGGGALPILVLTVEAV